MCSVRKGVLKNFAKLTGKHLCQSLFFNKARPVGASVNNSFALKNDKISHFESFNYASHLKGANL